MEGKDAADADEQGVVVQIAGHIAFQRPLRDIDAFAGSVASVTVKSDGYDGYVIWTAFIIITVSKKRKSRCDYTPALSPFYPMFSL